MRIAYCILLFLVAVTLLFSATKSVAQMKTVELDEVTIEALPFEKFTTGSKTKKSDSLQMTILGQGTLSDYMQQNTTVYIKESGNKMLASVSFRGTGSSHTGVFWHGVNLNSLTLGNSDFNGFPLFLFDDITVHYGGASSLHGSDAIGGSIHLSSQPKWTEGSSVQLRQDVGSFGNYFTGVKVNLGNGKWESKTRVFNRLLKNNFTYSITDRVGDKYEVEQKNAEVHNYGLLQEFNSKISDNGYLSLKGWIGTNYHQVQPLMVTGPDENQSGDEIEDKNLRLIAEYEHFFKNGILLSGIGYVWDYQLFNETDVIETNRLLGNLSYEWNLSDKTVLKVGGNSKYIVPKVWSYDNNLTEWRGDVFLSLNQELIKNWKLSVNARKTFVPFTPSPVAPSISTSYLIDQGNVNFTFRGQVERSYRIPTFNDRYWGQQGRADLKSEKGYSLELGHNLEWQHSNFFMNFDVAAFYMKVDDWIAWKPSGNLWRPYNLKEVEVAGIELNNKWKWRLNQGEFELGGMYAYNRSVLLQGISDSDQSVGYQLPYTPKHRFGLHAILLYKTYRFSINSYYTGKRNGIDVINEEIDDFLLTNITMSKNISIGKQVLSVEGQILNVMDVDYQNVNRYAMPGRNYLLSLNIFINQ
jgi:vitamin B12 transporter